MSIRRCAPTCRTFSPSAISSASRCWRTRRCMKAMSPRKRRPDKRSHFDARVIPSVAYTDPEVAWVGVTEDSAKAKGIKFGKSSVPVGRFGPGDRQRARRRLHQADRSTRRDPPRHRRRHRRHPCRRPDRRNRARHRNGLRPGRYRQDHPSRIRRWANRSAWPPKCSKGSVPICRRRKNDGSESGNF